MPREPLAGMGRTGAWGTVINGQSRSWSPKPRRFQDTHLIWRQPLFWIGTGLFIGLVLLCFAGPRLYHAGPLAVHITQSSRPPSLRFPLGTDVLGRNELSRIMFGGRLLILMALGSAVSATIFGVGVGLASAYLGGMIDRVASWVMDVVLSIPQLVPLLLISFLFTSSPTTMIIVISATTWPMVARPVRAEALSIRNRPYIAAALSLGASPSRIMGRYIFPATGTTVLMSASNSVSTAVVVLATASFLGISLPPPWPNWASMIADGISQISFGEWWLWVCPALALVCLVLSINTVTEAARIVAYKGGSSS